MKLIKVKNNVECYSKESVERKLEAMQDTMDFLRGQNQRLKRLEGEFKLWKDVLNGWSRWGIKRLIEKEDKDGI